MEVVDTPNSKQPRLAPSADHAAGDPDLISSLGDNVLLRILELVSDAKILVRTGGLSRRWRGLWTQTAVLHFRSPRELQSAGDVERYAAFVSNVLAQRAQQSSTNSLEDLKISYKVAYLRQDEELVPLCIKDARDWVRDAVLQHQVKSFRFYLSLHRRYDDDEDYDYSGLGTTDDSDDYVNNNDYIFYDRDDDYTDDDDKDQDDVVDYEGKYIIDLDTLPRSVEKLETMVLSFGDARLRLPGDVVFSSLTDLRLEHIKVARGSEHRFFRFLSKGCCPRLKKLSMSNIQISGRKKLLLESDALLELTLLDVMGSMFLKLRAPILRVLRIEDCHVEETLSILAPRLEDFTFLRNYIGTDLEGDFSSVKRLNFQLDSSRMRHTDDRISLLQRCSSATSLHVSLQPKYEWESTTLDIIEGSVTQVTSLVVCPSYKLERLGLGDVASLLSRFSNLRFLRVHLEKSLEDSKDNDLHSNQSYGIDDNWESYEISFAHLQEAEFSRLTGTLNEFRFLQYVLTSANGLEKVTARFSKKCFEQEGMRDYLELKLLPLIGRGPWSACRDDNRSYQWRPCRT